MKTQKILVVAGFSISVVVKVYIRQAKTKARVARINKINEVCALQLETLDFIAKNVANDDMSLEEFVQHLEDRKVFIKAVVHY